MTGRGRARVGCSGWQYRDWRGVVYPPEVPQRSWLRHYATLFDTVEVNNSFYRLPSESAVSGWAASVPPGFVFALKLGAFGSHRMKLRDAASWLPNHMVRVQLLGDAAGPTLVQLPPRWRRNAERLDEFLSVAPPTTRWAVELRERSWLHDEVYDVLRAPPRRAVRARPPGRSSLPVDDRLDVRPLPRSGRARAEVLRGVRVSPTPTVGDTAERRARLGTGRVLLLQQRLGGSRRR